MWASKHAALLSLKKRIFILTLFIISQFINRFIGKTSKSKRTMKIALIADVFPPQRSSGAVQLRDLAKDLLMLGHQVCVMVADPDINNSYELDNLDGVAVLRLKTFQTKGRNYLFRTIAETLMPLLMLRGLWISPFRSERWDGVVWYSPTIFLGILSYLLKRINKCQSYLILRDIFPQWAADMGIISRYGLPYFYLNFFAKLQYNAADTIGIQSPGNAVYFEKWRLKENKKLEILNNWLAPISNKTCSINLSETKLAGKFIFVYAGNMGVAQGLSSVIEAISHARHLTNIGFLFVGRGSECQVIAEKIKLENLDNILLFDEIESDEIPQLYAQCDAGIVSLDLNHRSHNIPGKFLTYVQSGLPVIAKVNKNNDLIDLIVDNEIGYAYSEDETKPFIDGVMKIINLIQSGENLNQKCVDFFQKNYTSEVAAKQIIQSISQ